MAWFDYVGGLAKGVQGAASVGLADLQRRKAEESALVQQEMGRLPDDGALTPDQAKRFARHLGAGAIRKDLATGGSFLQRTKAEETAQVVMGRQRVDEANRRKFEEMMETPAGRAKFNAMSPDDQIHMLRRAGIPNPTESGLISPETATTLGTRSVRAVTKQMEALAAAEAKAALLERQLAEQNNNQLATLAQKQWEAIMADDPSSTVTFAQVYNDIVRSVGRPPAGAPASTPNFSGFKMRGVR